MGMNGDVVHNLSVAIPKMRAVIVVAVKQLL
jgi:hypothetical protein